MNNPRLLGMARADNFNLKGSMCVIAVYGVITIISYFNELNKAGLLKRGVYPQPLAHYRFDKGRMERSIDMGNIIQKNGDIHSLGLEILKIKKDSKHKKTRKGGEEINIKVLLGKNGSYEKINNSVIHVYDHKNTLPNFYTSLNLTSLNLSASQLSVGNVSLISNLSSVISEADSRRQAYRKATLVYMYQHEPDTYLIRDCLKNISQEKDLAVNNLPLSSNHRKMWENMSRHRKGEFHVLYGGLSFGVCETVGRPCNYITLVSHPLDRLVALYHMCRPPVEPSLKSLCRMNNADRRHRTLKDFILTQGSGFFQKLVYYAKHCRLIGEDEICLQDSRTSFVFTPKEMQLHLEHVLQHLEVWFGVVGIVDRLPESLDMFQKIYGHAFFKCYNDRLTAYRRNASTSSELSWVQHLQSKKRDHKSYLDKHQREKLLNDTTIAKALAPDLAIYQKLVEIFNKQVLFKKALAEHKKSLRLMSAKQRMLLKQMKSETAVLKHHLLEVKHGGGKALNASRHLHNISLSTVARTKRLLLKLNTVPQVRNDSDWKKLRGAQPRHAKNSTAGRKHLEKHFFNKKDKHGRKGGSTSHPLAGLDTLLYQNYSVLEKHMKDGLKKSGGEKKIKPAWTKQKRTLNASL